MNAIRRQLDLSHCAQCPPFVLRSDAKRRVSKDDKQLDAPFETPAPRQAPQGERYRLASRVLLLALALVALTLTGCPRTQQVRPNWLNIANEATLRGLAQSDARAQRDLGLHFLLVTGDVDAAREALVNAAQRDAADPLTWLALGVLRIEHGQPIEAMADLGRSVRAAHAARQHPDWCIAPGVEPATAPEHCVLLASIIEEAAGRLLRESDYEGRADIASGLLDQGGTEFPSTYNLLRALEHDARVGGQADAARRYLQRSGYSSFFGK